MKLLSLIKPWTSALLLQLESKLSRHGVLKSGSGCSGGGDGVTLSLPKSMAHRAAPDWTGYVREQTCSAGRFTWHS